MFWNLIGVAVFAWSPRAMAQVGPDHIWSFHIKEALADGDPSDSDSGFGIKTPHINNGAVTGAKIASGAVQSSHIAMYNNTAIVAPAGGDYTNPAVAMKDYETWCGGASESNPCLLKIMPGVYDVGDSYISMQDYIDIEGSGVGTTKIVANGYRVVYANSVSGAELRRLTVENVNANLSGWVSGAELIDFTGKLTDVDVEISNAPEYALGINVRTGQLDMRRVSVNVSGSAASRAYGIEANGIVGRWTDVDVSVSSNGSSAYVYGLVGVGSSSYALEVFGSRFHASGAYRATGAFAGDVVFDKCTVSASGSGTSYGMYVGRESATRVFNSRIAGDTYSVFGASGVADVHGSVMDGHVSGEVFVGNSQIVGGTGSGVVCAGVYDEGYTFYANSCP
jgi:hypothetical protein